MRLEVSSPVTRYDLCFHETINAAVASPTVLAPDIGAIHAGSVPGTIPTIAKNGPTPGSANFNDSMKGKETRTKVAAAIPTDNTLFVFVITDIQPHLF